jgi:hypothetical protein
MLMKMKYLNKNVYLCICIYSRTYEPTSVKHMTLNMLEEGNKITVNMSYNIFSQIRCMIDRFIDVFRYHTRIHSSSTSSKYRVSIK